MELDQNLADNADPALVDHPERQGVEITQYPGQAGCIRGWKDSSTALRPGCCTSYSSFAEQERLVRAGAIQDAHKKVAEHDGHQRGEGAGRITNPGFSR